VAIFPRREGAKRDRRVGRDDGDGEWRVRSFWWREEREEGRGRYPSMKPNFFGETETVKNSRPELVMVIWWWHININMYVCVVCMRALMYAHTHGCEVGW
jgi:hypothetical protein